MRSFAGLCVSHIGFFMTTATTLALQHEYYKQLRGAASISQDERMERAPACLQRRLLAPAAGPRSAGQSLVCLHACNALSRYRSAVPGRK